jgi:hypothetical protein
VWKEKDGHQQFRLRDQNIVMQNKLVPEDLNLKISLLGKD